MRNPQGVQQVSPDGVKQAERVVQHFFGAGFNVHDPADTRPRDESKKLHGMGAGVFPGRVVHPARQGH